MSPPGKTSLSTGQVLGIIGVPQTRLTPFTFGKRREKDLEKALPGNKEKVGKGGSKA